MKKDTKQRLFEVMGKLDPSFKRLNENIGDNVVRSTNTDSPTLDLNKTYVQNRNKPVGVWYEIDDNWKGWCHYEMPEWIKKYDIVLDVDMANILKIDTEEKAYKLLVNYLKKDDEINALDAGLPIDWNKVANDYKGIEMTNVDLFKMNSTLIRANWIYNWDVDSGCIWDLSAIKNYSVKDCTEHTIEDN